MGLLCNLGYGDVIEYVDTYKTCNDCLFVILRIHQILLSSCMRISMTGSYSLKTNTNDNVYLLTLIIITDINLYLPSYSLYICHVPHFLLLCC